MGSFFIFLACIVFLAVQNCIGSTKQAIKNKQYEEERRINNFNFVLQFQLEYRVRELPWEFEDKTGMNMSIIANVMSARHDKVEYDPEVYCAGGFKSTAENAVISYLLKQEGYNVNPDEHRKRGVDIELSIPEDYVMQGR
ncbi:MAG TPA: hypothetical protein VM577_04730, partial [Anaerovoracaceae bacterium]|nr:hypothetical protein [Anaerovoracaceae bacterium]